MLCTCHSHAALSRRTLLGLGSLAASALALWAPSRAAAQGSASRAIDVHAHYFPQKLLKALAEDGNSPAGLRVDMSKPDAPAFFYGTRRMALDPTYWDLEGRLKRMDSQGVQTHALSLTAPMVHSVAPDRGVLLARIFNDALMEAHTAYPERFVGCATLPLQDPDLALKELNRVAGHSAIRGAYFPTTTAARELSSPDFFPLYERCEALNLPVLLHPVTVIGQERLQKAFYLGNLLGNPMDSTIAAAHLVFGGVLDRFPRLNIVMPHAGGALPYLWGRLQHGQEVRPEAKDKAKLPFRDYLRRFHYDTIGHAPELVQFLVGLVGADRVMLGSDYCFDMGYERPREIIERLNLSAADKALIFGGNAARLLRLT